MKILKPPKIRHLPGDTRRYGYCSWMVQDRKEYLSIMWARMNGFCKELGFAHECAKGDFIPEPLFYRLGMKANNTVADKFQNWLAFKTQAGMEKPPLVLWWALGRHPCHL